MNEQTFIEREPVEKRRDPITGRILKGEESCLPFNRNKVDWNEMDNWFCGE